MSPRPLADLQTAFHDHLLGLPSTIAEAVASGGIGVEHRLHIYHHAYRARLLENLRDAYEKTWTYIGDATFDAAALDFIESHPPTHRNLRWHGDAFPEFLAARFSADPEIAELAILDWELRRAFDGPDAAAIDAQGLAGLDASHWESVGFRFLPTLTLIPVRFNSTAIWHALDEERPPPPAERLPDDAWVMIWRRGWQPHFRTLDVTEHAALSSLLSGASFAELCERLAVRHGDEAAATQTGAFLATWLADGLIAGLSGI